MVVRSLTGGCSVAAGVAGFATGSRTAPGSLALADDSAQVSRRYVSQVEFDVRPFMLKSNSIGLAPLAVRSNVLHILHPASKKPAPVARITSLRQP